MTVAGDGMTVETDPMAVDLPTVEVAYFPAQ